ncbi:MAG: hypothetical protein ACRDS9_07550 [Pseudonocardiaceae bacterium]
MLSFLREIVLIALLAAVACVVVGWLLPRVLQAAAEPLTDGVAFLAAVLLLPEYWLSTAMRERRGSPPAISYQYGDAVAGTARVLQCLFRELCSGLAEGARRTPLPLVAIAVVALRVYVLLVAA